MNQSILGAEGNEVDEQQKSEPSAPSQTGADKQTSEDNSSTQAGDNTLPDDLQTESERTGEGTGARAGEYK